MFEPVVNAISSQPLLALAIIVILILVMLYQTVMRGVSKFTGKTKSTSKDDSSSEMQEIIDEIHAAQSK